jgi:hypothetical protein
VCTEEKLSSGRGGKNEKKFTFFKSIESVEYKNVRKMNVGISMQWRDFELMSFFYAG